MKAPAMVLSDLMKDVRMWFYSPLPERAWFTQQERVKAALTLPAKWLDERGVEISAVRYQEILKEILATIKANGRRPAKMGPYPCAYLHSCVERHMQHHGEDYYNEGKAIRSRVKLFMSEFEKSQVGADATVPTLAKVHDAVAVGRRKPKNKAAAEALQPDFFGGTK